MIRFVTSFNREFYNHTAKTMLASVREHMPNSQLLMYVDGDVRQYCPSTNPEVEGFAPYSFAEIECLETFKTVRRQNLDVIPESYGGKATKPIGRDIRDQGFNNRWFGWFRKIVAQHDAIVNKPSHGYTIWLDTDVRMMKPIDEEFLNFHMAAPVGIFFGQRPYPDTGVVIWNESKPMAKEMAHEYLRLYTSGEFRRLKRYDDTSTMKQLVKRNRGQIQDFAFGVNPVEITNSNGHKTGGQVICQTDFGKIFEHDKGIHWREGLVDSTRR